MSKSDKRKAIADELRALAAKVEDQLIEIVDAQMKAEADIADGMAPGGAWHEYRRNGRFTYDIHIDLYVPESDDAQESDTWWKLQPSSSEIMGRAPWTG